MKKLLSAIIMVLLLSILSFYVDNLFNNHRIYNSLTINKVCDYQVPTNYKIVFNGKRYAVRDLQYGDYYLWRPGFGDIQGMFSHITKCDDFADSCSAKGLLKMYLEQNAPKMKNYK